MAARLSPEDPNSYALPEECVITDLHLEVEVDFKRKVVHGTGTYSCRRVTSADTLILDTDGLTISKVYCKQSSQELQFTLAEADSKFGSKLQIILLPSFDVEFEICIDFENSPTASGLQWLTKEQTAGKRQPYMFSQFESIMARTVLPCQDTPAVKHPYRAKVTVDKALTVLMSAVPQGNEAADDDKITYEFYQKVPIPSYLIAIAVGDLVSRQIGKRSKVWTEQEMIEKAAYEFAETETMLKTAEDICGPYVWGVYDLLVLPPSFPFGGMENPCLTFVTPTLLAGDRSATNTIAHEISHSWTGNLVTNKNWEHFWLNEGHTVFVERKIIGRMYGEKHRHFAMITGWTALYEAIVEVFGVTNPLTKLVVDLSGVHPDESFSSVPYERGAALLFALEAVLGGAEVFEGWLKAYLLKFKGQSITTDEWKDFLYSYFDTQNERERLMLEQAGPDDGDSGSESENPEISSSESEDDSSDGEEDLEEPVCSENEDVLFLDEDDTGEENRVTNRDVNAIIRENPDIFTTGESDEEEFSFWEEFDLDPYDDSLFAACEALSKQWLAGTDLPTDSADFDSFSTNQKLAFLSALVVGDPMPVDRVLQMGTLYKLPENNNAEIKCRWLQLCLRAGTDNQLDVTLKFVTDVGRMKFVRPLYKDMYKLESVRQRAISTFKANRPNMHLITAKMVAEDVHLNE